MTRWNLRSLRAWMVVILPMIALFLLAVLRPTTATVVAEHAAVVVLAITSLCALPRRSPAWRRSGVAFAVVAVGSLYAIPATLLPSYVLQWESRDGPGLEEPSVFRAQAFGEFSSLVVVPMVALVMGLVAAAVAKAVPPLPWYPLLLAILLIGLLVLLLLPVQQ